MAKKPEIETIEANYFQKYRIANNFENIFEAFVNTLSRDGSLPNFMTANLDVADANITNVNQVDVGIFRVQDTPWTGFGEEYVWKLGQLNCGTGAIITHDVNGDPTCFGPGDNGEVLKTRNNYLNWEEDIDTNTDTDTVGITVQEDGVTVAENVTQIDFIWTDTDICSTPNTDQVDLELPDLLGPLYENADQNDANLDPSASAIFNNAAEVRRLDLFTDVGISDAETGLSSGTSHTAVVEGNNDFLTGGQASGSWQIGFRFYQSDGTSTVGTGTQILTNQVTGSVRAGGALLTRIQDIPAGTRYVEFAWSLLPVSPLSLTKTGFSDRYTAIILGSQNGTFETPNGHTTTGDRPKNIV